MANNNRNKTIGSYGEFCEALHNAVFGDKCVFCAEPRYKSRTICKKCHDSCPKPKTTYDEVTVRVKIRKD